ncbi:MAG: hypothetical protein K6G33_10810 [Ruminococcus sp.]|uniref:hypothetical protein n=1 Tax=Ruminococcus sp. TaxID=41978 RepID=UPI0025D071E1|nr:hypothetical protein [Ruminococcus sp.]MCR5601215.1 hypothetical protein [Ruminococcus sp.]
MKASRISALIIALFFTSSYCSCSLSHKRQSRSRDKEREFAIGQSYAPDKNSKDKLYTPQVRLADVEDAATGIFQKLESDVYDENISKEIELGFKDMLYYSDKLCDSNTLAEISFYSHCNDNAASNISEKAYNDMLLSHLLTEYIIFCGYNSPYKELFKDYLTKDMVQKFEDDDSLPVDIRIRGEFYLDEHPYNLYLNKHQKLSAKNGSHESDLEYAETLISNLKEHKFNLYTQYNRDYTGEDIIRLNKAIKNILLPAYDELTLTYLTSYEHQNNIESITHDPFDIINRYARKLSSPFAENAQKLIDQELFTICNDTDAADLSFTDIMPSQHSARIFIGDPYNRTDLLPDAIRQFGHFNAELEDDTPVFLYENNIDIAQLHSAGMQMLFLQFYDDIYEDMSKFEKLRTVKELLDSVISGFLIGEFEYSVAIDSKDITPEEAVERFNELFSDYDYTYRLSNISSYLEKPGYCISCGVSALAALEMYDDVFNAPEKALERYKNIADVSCHTFDSSFRSALHEAGFKDVMTEEFITELADLVMRIDAEYN